MSKVWTSAKFQGTPLSKRLPETSAPYTGELFWSDFQNYKIKGLLGTYLFLNFFRILFFYNLSIFLSILFKSIHGTSHLFEESEFVSATSSWGLLDILLNGSYKIEYVLNKFTEI